MNTVARLEQINKELGSRILICESTYASVSGTIPAHAVGTHVIRGKSHEVRPYVVDHEKMSGDRFEAVRQSLFDKPTRLDSIPPPMDAGGAGAGVQAYAQTVPEEGS